MLDKTLIFECLKCGNCLFYCPVYNIEKEETYSPRGRLSLLEMINEEDFPLLRKEFLQECLLCGACEKNCNANIKITDIYILNRVKFKSDSPAIKKIALKFFTKGFLNLYKHLFLFFKYTPFSILPKFSLKFKIEKRNFDKKVVLFSGCVANYLITEIKDSAIYILNLLGYEVITPPFNCCGFPFLSAGDMEQFEALRNENSKIIQKYENLPIITLCPTGNHTLKDYYGFDNIIEFAEFLNREEKYKKLIKRMKKLEDKISIHIPCHYINFFEHSEYLRKSLENIQEVQLYEPERQMCCGFGGMFSISYPKVSNKILEKSIKNLKVNEGRKVITNCPGCLVQLSRKSEAYHLAIYLAKMIENSIK